MVDNNFLENYLLRARHYLQSNYRVYENALINIGSSIEQYKLEVNNVENEIEIEIASRESEDDFQLERIYYTELPNEVIENLLGVSFVLCQAYITNIVSTVRRTKEYIEKNFENHNSEIIRRLGGKKYILKFPYDETSDDNKYTAIEIIDAFANYFKHHDEWDTKEIINSETNEKSYDWNNHANKTIKIIKAVGASCMSKDNLRIASKYLNNTEYKPITFLKTIEKWRSELSEFCDDDLDKISKLNLQT